MQCGQRVALIGIDERQYGHSLTTGAAAGFSSPRRILFTARTIRKTTKATIRKLITALKKRP